MDKTLGEGVPKDPLDLIALISCKANFPPLGQSKVVNPHPRGFIRKTHNNKLASEQSPGALSFTSDICWCTFAMRSRAVAI